MDVSRHVVITGGAGYIGSLLTGHLLQSGYAVTVIDDLLYGGESKYLLAQANSACTQLIFRLANLYGLSPRTRFDLIVNQFVLDAYTRRELAIYQRGYSRSFLQVSDAAGGFLLGLSAPEEAIRGQIYNLGSQEGNYTKDELVALILKRIPETMVRYKDITFGGDMRDITVSFEKVHQQLGFTPKLTVNDGVREVLHALRDGIINDPYHTKYRNTQFIVQ